MLRNIGLSCFRQSSYHRSLAGCFRPFSSEKPTGSPPASHVPNMVDKYVLVWQKKYPSVKDVPLRVTADEMERARNWIRIKINIGACIATVFACIYMVKKGKDALKSGESVRKMNVDWHKSQK